MSFPANCRSFCFAAPLLLLIGFGMTAGGCAGNAQHRVPYAHHPAETVKHDHTPAAAAPAHYVGSAACIACHYDEGHKWLGSRHQLTLRRMNPGVLGSLAPPHGIVPGTGGEFSLTAASSSYLVHQKGSGRSMTLALALGSGKTGMTYVAFERDQVIEFRESYFPHSRAWYPTPGTEDVSFTLPGKLHPPPVSRTCIGCHSVTLPANGLTPDSDLFGIGCERCHGPGSAHIAAVTAGKTSDPALADLSKWPAARINQLCASCHRGVKDVDLGSLAVASTNRFQPLGIALSRCFTGSGGRLSCVTCHDPHTNVSTDTRGYEKICLSCHSSIASHAAAAGPHAAGATGNAVTQGKVCPVNPTSGCIPCHMPARKAIPDSTLPIIMNDHWIRVFKAHSP